MARNWIRRSSPWSTPPLVGGTTGQLGRVGRMNNTPGFVVLLLETPDGPEHLIVNLQPGILRKVPLADGRELATDGPGCPSPARRVDARRGGPSPTSAAWPYRQASWSGRVVAVGRSGGPAAATGSTSPATTTPSLGWFEVDATLPEALRVAGRTLHIRHGDGTTHGWTLMRVEPLGKRRSRLHVREEPGFTLEGSSRDPTARYYQFPGTTSPGPHPVRDRQHRPVNGSGSPSLAGRCLRDELLEGDARRWRGSCGWPGRWGRGRRRDWRGGPPDEGSERGVRPLGSRGNRGGSGGRRRGGGRLRRDGGFGRNDGFLRDHGPSGHAGGFQGNGLSLGLGPGPGGGHRLGTSRRRGGGGSRSRLSPGGGLRSRGKRGERAAGAG